MGDRVCLVTGATGGMGVAIVRGLVNAGARVVATDRSPEALADLAEGLGTSVVWHAADLADDGVAEALVAIAVERFGRLDARSMPLASRTRRFRCTSPPTTRSIG